MQRGLWTDYTACVSACTVSNNLNNFHKALFTYLSLWRPPFFALLLVPAGT